MGAAASTEAQAGQPQQNGQGNNRMCVASLSFGPSGDPEQRLKAEQAERDRAAEESRKAAADQPTATAKKVEDPTAGLSAEEKVVYEVFLMFDADRSGSIDVKELDQAMRMLGFTPGPDEAKNMIAKFDKTGSGKMMWPEFLEMMGAKMGLAPRPAPPRVEPPKPVQPQASAKNVNAPGSLQSQSSSRDVAPLQSQPSAKNVAPLQSQPSAKNVVPPLKLPSGEAAPLQAVGPVTPHSNEQKRLVVDDDDNPPPLTQPKGLASPTAPTQPNSARSAVTDVKADASAPQSPHIPAANPVENSGPKWVCPTCTFFNVMKSTKCEMCLCEKPPSEEELAEQQRLERERILAEEKFKPGKLNIKLVKGQCLLDKMESGVVYAMVFLQSDKEKTAMSKQAALSSEEPDAKWDESLPPFEIMAPTDQRLSILVYRLLKKKQTELIGLGDIKLDHQSLKLEDGLTKKVEVPLKFKDDDGVLHRLMRGDKKSQVQASVTILISFSKKSALAEIENKQAQERVRRNSVQAIANDGNVPMFSQSDTQRDLRSSRLEQAWNRADSFGSRHSDPPEEDDKRDLDNMEVDNKESPRPSVGNGSESKVNTLALLGVGVHRSSLMGMPQPASFGGAGFAGDGAFAVQLTNAADPTVYDIKLRVRIVKCLDLMHVYNGRDFSKSSPYAVVWLEKAKKKKKEDEEDVPEPPEVSMRPRKGEVRSPVIKHTLFPEWDFEIPGLLVQDFAKESLRVSIRDANADPHREMGNIEIRLSNKKLQLDSGATKGVTMPLKNGTGTVTLTLQLYTEAAFSEKEGTIEPEGDLPPKHQNITEQFM